MKSELEVLMLAGGKGSRMGSLTEHKQKCLLPIEERPIISHIIDRLVLAFGSVDLKIAVSFKGEDVAGYIDRNKPSRVSVTYIPIPPGVHDYEAYKRARGYMHGTFLAVPGDIIIAPSAYTQVMELLASSQAHIATTLSPLQNIADTHPVAKTNGIEIVEYLAKPPAQLDHDHLRDLMIFGTDRILFHYIDRYPNPDGYFGDVFQNIVQREHSLSASLYQSPWLHVGYPEDLLKPLPR